MSGLVDTFVGFSVRADLRNGVFDGDAGRSLLRDRDLVLSQVVHVYDFDQPFDALLRRTNGEGFDVGRLDADVGVSKDLDWRSPCAASASGHSTSGVLAGERADLHCRLDPRDAEGVVVLRSAADEGAESAADVAGGAIARLDIAEDVQLVASEL